MTGWRFVLFAALWLGLFGVAGAEPAPLRVGPVSIVVTDIYDEQELSRDSGLLHQVHKAMNTIHPSTRRYVIRRELLFAEGDVLTEDSLAETARNLRALGFLTDVAVVPTDTLPDGTVPLEVRVQETWSLSTQFTFSRSSSANRWTALISDRNFLGYGVQLLAGLGRDEDRNWKQLRFQDRRFLGRDLRLSLATYDLSDGYVHEAGFSKPFYAVRDPWSFNVAGWRRRFEPRYYLNPSMVDGVDSDVLRLYVQPVERSEGWRAEVIRRLAGAEQGRVWRLGAGVRSERKSWGAEGLLGLSTGGAVSLTDVASASSAFARDQGRTVQTYLTVETIGDHWTTDRYVLRYGPEEDILLDPWLRLTAGPTLDALGGDRQRFLYDVVVQDWSRLGIGWLFLQGRTEGAAGRGDRRWHRSEFVGGWLAHQFGGMTRLWAEGVAAQDPPGTMVPVLGLTRGLRTLENDGMNGDRLLRWNAEHARLIPGELLGFFKVGVAGFYSGGAAWWDGGERGLDDAVHELGVGLRFGPTRSSNAELARLDLAWDLAGGGPKLTAATGGLF